MSGSVLRRPASRILTLALVVAALPWPAVAQESRQIAPRPALQASIAPAVRVVAATSYRSSQNERQQAQPVEKAALESRSFFRTPAGIVVLAIVAGGAGYAFYSMSHDRIAPKNR